MSPILVRPVREQLEHDRIIRFLQAKHRRRYDAGINPGNEQNVPVGNGPSSVYPDLVLASLERGHRLQAVIEVETGESVNHLEALAQWVHLSKLRADFHLYVPAGMVDVARRLCEDNQIQANEIWSYHTVGDQVRFTIVHRSRESSPATRAHSAAPRVKPGVRAKSAPAPRKPVKKAPRRDVPQKAKKAAAAKRAKPSKTAGSTLKSAKSKKSKSKKK